MWLYIRIHLVPLQNSDSPKLNQNLSEYYLTISHSLELHNDSDSSEGCEPSF